MLLSDRFQDVAHDLSPLPLVWVHGDGTVYYVPRQTYQTPCRFNMHKFPYDSQHCQIILGSWAYLSNEVGITNCLHLLVLIETTTKLYGRGAGVPPPPLLKIV